MLHSNYLKKNCFLNVKENNELNLIKVYKISLKLKNLVQNKKSKIKIIYLKA